MAPLAYRRYAGSTGLALYAASAALIAASFVLVAFLRADHLFGAAALGTLPLGLWLYARARRARVRIFASDTDLIRTLDARGDKLILFLREFASDGAPLRETDGGLADIFVTEEERIAATLGDYGTILAIGQPGERLPAAGSCRLYVENDRWREVVGRLVDRADLIVLRPGASAGISWELEQIVARKRASRTALVPAQDLRKNLATYDRLRALFPEPPDPMKAQVERIAASDMVDDDNMRMIRDLHAKMTATQNVINQLALVPKLAPALYRLRDGRLERSKGTLQEALVAVAHELALPMRTAARLKFVLIIALVLAPIVVLLSPYLACPLLSPDACEMYKEGSVWAFLVVAVALFVMMFLVV